MKAKINKVDDIECTLEFTMRIKDWKNVRNTLRENSAWAEMELISDITELVNKLEATLYPDIKD